MFYAEQLIPSGHWVKVLACMNQHASSISYFPTIILKNYFIFIFYFLVEDILII